MRRAGRFFLATLGALTLAATQVHSQEWGFSSPEGAVVKVVRDNSLKMSGMLALPASESGKSVVVPVKGRNEPGKLILQYDDPDTGAGQTITYRRAKSPDGAYAVWAADDAPYALRELRAPINVSGGSAKTALDNWSANTDDVIPVEIYSRAVKASRKGSTKSGAKSKGALPVAVVTDRPRAAAWDGAASRIGADLKSVQTFSTKGVIFTMDQDDLVAALDNESELLRDLGGVKVSLGRRRPSAVIPLASLSNFHKFTVPLANMFDTYAVEDFDISKIEGEIDALFSRLSTHKIECAVSETATGSFSVGCLHHGASHNLRGNFLINTTFIFCVGELRGRARQIFVMADSWAATARQDDPTPGSDRFTHHRSDQPVVATAHEVALSTLRAELGEMFKGFRSD